MTPERARRLFDAALDEELSADEQHEFDEALADDPALAAEYARHRGVLQAAASELGAAPSVDLLAGVQHKLRARSGGKFYRDRFSQRTSSGMSSNSLKLLIVTSACLIVGVLLWFAYGAGLLVIER
jgi:anti-sigma factor RsiW